MFLLAETAPELAVSPTTTGVVVIVLMQLAQFVFAWKKDTAREQGAKKEDLAALRKELKAEIAEVANKAEKTHEGLSGELRVMSRESETARKELQENISSVAIETAGLKKGQEMIEQNLTIVAHKLDTLLSRTRRS